MYPYRIAHKQLKIHEVFNLAIPHGNFSTYYNINNRYLGIKHDKTKAVEISEDQFDICQKANKTVLQFKYTSTTTHESTNMYNSFICQRQSWHQEEMLTTKQESNSVSIPSSITPSVWNLTTAPTAVSTGITLIYPGETPRFIKTQTPVHTLQLPAACSTTSQHFYIPPCYETHMFTINISLNTANLDVVHVSSPEFRIWQHLEDNWNGAHLHHLVKIPSVPIDQLYKQMVRCNVPFNPFMSTDESIGGAVSIWTLFSHTGVYVMAIGLFIPAGLGIF